jgi:hypothetical protein
VDYAALTARCRARLDELDLPRPFDVRTLCADLGRRRGRPVELVEMALPAGAPSGLWLSTGQRDYIVYEQATSPLHQEHIILHEVSHLLCGHTGGSMLSEEHISHLFPQLDPGMIRRVLGRAGYSSEEEQEAEMLASMILRRAERHRRAPRVTDPAAADNLRRLEAGL